MLSHLEDGERLFPTLLYGTGLRLLEGLRLRVKDSDFAAGGAVPCSARNRSTASRTSAVMGRRTWSLRKYNALI